MEGEAIKEISEMPRPTDKEILKEKLKDIFNDPELLRLLYEILPKLPVYDDIILPDFPWNGDNISHVMKVFINETCTRSEKTGTSTRALLKAFRIWCHSHNYPFPDLFEDTKGPYNLGRVMGRFETSKIGHRYKLELDPEYKKAVESLEMEEDIVLIPFIEENEMVQIPSLEPVKITEAPPLAQPE